MKKTLIVLLTGLLISSVGCNAPQNNIPADSFRIEATTLVDSDDILVKHIVIEAPGQRTVRISEGRDSDMARIAPDHDTNIMTAEITLVATLVDNPKPTVLKWLAQIKGAGVTVGGPSSFPVDAKTLEDILEIDIDTGLYKLEQDIEIGRLQGKPIVLLVE